MAFKLVLNIALNKKPNNNVLFIIQACQAWLNSLASTVIKHRNDTWQSYCSILVNIKLFICHHRLKEMF